MDTLSASTNFILAEESIQKPQREVGFKAIIRNINDVDTTNQDVFIDLWVGVFDIGFELDSATLAFQKNYISTNDDDTWKSNFEAKIPPPWSITLLNAKDESFVYKQKGLPTLRAMKDENSNYVRYFERQHVKARFSQNFDLVEFPFDKQQLKIIVSLDVGTNLAKFCCANREGKDRKYEHISVMHDMGHFNFLTKSEWAYDENDPNSCDIFVNEVNVGNEYHRLEIVLSIKRNYTRWLIIVIVPLGLIILISLYVLFHSSTADTSGTFDSFPKLNLLSTLMLAVISMRFGLSDQLPKIPYVCKLDHIFSFSYFIIVSAMVLCVINDSQQLVTDVQNSQLPLNANHEL